VRYRFQGVCALTAVLVLGGCAPLIRPFLKETTCGPEGEVRLERETRQCLAVAATPLGALRTIPVDSGKPWVCTGVLIEAGKSYEIAVPGNKEWLDEKTKANVDEGWVDNRVLGFFLRFSARVWHAPMFALVGGISENGQEPSSYFRIGSKHRLDTSTSGQLVVFANDWEQRYCNNHGTVEMTVAPAK
jgi:hypothetical protein